MGVRRSTRAVLSTLLMLLCATARHAPAQDATPTPSDAATSAVSVSGFVDTYFNWNFERPRSHTNRFRNFDITENQFVVSAAEVDIQRAANPIGFSIEANYGAATDIIHAGTPGTLNTFQQAFLRVAVPIGAGLTIDAGKFVTHMGYETIKAKENANYSRSFLFAWAIPYFHLGVRASYPVTEHLTVGACICNGWNAATLNSGKTFGASLSFAPTSSLLLLANWVGGPEQPDSLGNNLRHVVEAIVGVKANERVSFAVDAMYGRETVAGAAITWKGIALYARYALGDASDIALRAEVYSDHEGYTTGLNQDLKEVTLTYEYRIVANLALRTEFRHDWSSVPAFDGRSGVGTMTHQSTLGLGSIISF